MNPTQQPTSQPSAQPVMHPSGQPSRFVYFVVYRNIVVFSYLFALLLLCSFHD